MFRDSLFKVNILIVYNVYSVKESKIHSPFEDVPLKTLGYAYRFFPPYLFTKTQNVPENLKTLYIIIKYFTLYFVKYSSDVSAYTYEGWNFNSGNYLFTTDTK